MIARLLHRAALWLALAGALACAGARADTPVALAYSFAGNVNFTGTQVTMRAKSNKANPCSVVSSSTQLSATLSGIPAGAAIVSAQLYWAGSNSQSNADYSVSFDGAAVSAPAARQYFSATSGAGYDYFGGAADVTAQVAAKGNGDYSFSGLTIANGNPYCGTEAVLGGFSLLVIYSSSAEPFRVLNLYEGFQYFRNSGITLNLANFLVPGTLPASATARLAHITWEGDSTLNQGGEDLLFNGAEMTDRMNPAGNQFNSASNINGDSRSWGIDFDAYTIAPSSGLLQPGQTTATTRYQSGQDLVLLGAEVVAVPNVPAADLSISMTRAGALQAGRATGYTLGVRNAGPYADAGPIVVTDTMPAGMSFISASGSGWSCALSGQAVTCSTPGPLAVGATLAPLTLMLAPGAAGTYTNSAIVRGQMFDNVPANSSASDTATASAAAAGAYAFTTSDCQPGAVLGAAGCLPFTGPVVAGIATPVWVTALSSGSPAVAMVLDAAADTTLSLRFGFACVDPVQGQGVSAAYPGAGAGQCAANGTIPATGSGAWGPAVPIVFAAGKPSARLAPNFAYDDVGTVTLGLLDAANRSAFSTFVVKPVNLGFAAVKRTVDGAPNPGAPGGVRPGFAKAGQAFTLTVGAKTATGRWAPNFGNEKDARWWPQIRLQQLQQVQQPNLPGVQGAFETAAGGFVTGTGFSWDEAGTVNLSPQLGDYQGAGKIDGAARDIGRFYPDHFDTAAYPAFPCLPQMACPAGIGGATYSAQPFRVEVRAIGMTGKALANYAGASVTLSAVDAAGGATVNPGGGTLADDSGNAAFTLTTVSRDPAAGASVRYTLPAMFSAAQPRATLAGPIAVHVRASAPESVVDASGVARPVTITSRRPAGSVEGGTMVVSGRLQLANAFGSELLRLPVRVNAQFWTGAAWYNNPNDSASEVAWAGNLAFSDCLGGLASAGACDTARLAPGPAPALRLQDGAGTFWLAAPGRGKAGSAWLQVKAGNPPWLPSTRARAVFGIYSSPVIYLREVH